MKILIVTESFYPSLSGVSISVQRSAAWLVTQGHEVAIMAPSQNKEFKIEKKAGYKVYRVASAPSPFLKGRRTTGSRSYRQIPRVFREVQPDIIHVHEPSILCLMAARLARKNEVPVLVNQHFMLDSLLHYVPAPKGLHKVIKRVAAGSITRFYNRCQGVVVPSKTVKKVLLTTKITVPVTVISNGVDTERFQPRSKPEELRQQYRIPKDIPVVGYVGRLDPEKNVATVLGAVAEIRKHQPVHMLIMGAGNLNKELHAQVEELGLHDNVTWIAPIKRPDLVASIYNLMDIFCIASASETESMVTMEAMASGLPVISAGSGALTELVVDGKNGYHADPLDPISWAKALEKLTSDKDLRKTMGKLGRERSLQRDLGKSLIAIEKLYIEVIEDFKYTKSRSS